MIVASGKGRAAARYGSNTDPSAVRGANAGRQVLRAEAVHTVHGRFRAAAILVSAMVFASAGGMTVSYLRARPLTAEQVAAQLRPSIVGVVQYQKGITGPYGEGSGIILSRNGYIVTNNHVVDGASRLEVVTASGKRYQATKVGSDARTDLAVVKIAAEGLRAAAFGDSRDCRVGEQVLAIGNPSGIRLAGSVTQGIISATGREIDVGTGPMSLIQTDAAINPGNSGGALVDMSGRVIGINSAKIAQQGYEGLGFAIPVSQAQPIIKSLIRYGYVKGRVAFGLACRILSERETRSSALPRGVRVEYVEKNSGAAVSGVRAGDIVTAMDGFRVATAAAFIHTRDRHRAGEQALLTVYRPSCRSLLMLPVKLTEDRGDGRYGPSALW